MLDATKSPSRAIVTGIVLVNDALGVLASFLWTRERGMATEFEVLVFAGTAIAVLAMLAYFSIAVAATTDLVPIRMRVRMALVPSLVACALSGSLAAGAHALAYSSAASTTFAVGWALLGWTFRNETLRLEREVDVYRARGEPTVRSSHFYWIRREEVFASMRPIDWRVKPPPEI